MNSNIITATGFGIGAIISGIAYTQYHSTLFSPEQFCSNEEFRNRLSVIFKGSVCGGLVSAFSHYFSSNSKKYGLLAASVTVLYSGTKLMEPLSQTIKSYSQSPEFRLNCSLIGMACIGTLGLTWAVESVRSYFLSKTIERGLENLKDSFDLDAIASKKKVAIENKIKRLTSQNAQAYLLSECKYWDIRYIDDPSIKQEDQNYILALILSFRELEKTDFKPFAAGDDKEEKSSEDSVISLEMLDQVFTCCMEKLQGYSEEKMRQYISEIRTQNFSGIESLETVPDCCIM